MTCAVVTMTTNLAVRGLEQAGWNAEIIRSLAVRECGGMEISAPDPVEGSEVLALALARARWAIQGMFESPEFWVLSGNSAVQPDSAVGRRRGFWGSLGSSFPANLGAQAIEWHVPSPGGLKFFTAIRKEQVSDELLLKLWHREKTTWLVACEGCDEQTFRSGLVDGWSPQRSAIPKELLEFASKLPMILVRALIADDGNALGVVAFGQSRWLARYEH